MGVKIRIPLSVTLLHLVGVLFKREKTLLARSYLILRGQNVVDDLQALPLCERRRTLFIRYVFRRFDTSIPMHIARAIDEGLRTIEAKLSELAEREVAARDRLNRIDLRAPQGGVVHELAVHTVGGVITAAEQVILIVPEEDDLTIQARVAPVDVDQVIVGRMAKLRPSACNQQQTPELDGRVVHVSADVTTDPQTGQTYYIARIAMDEKSRRTVDDLTLVPGMPVEVFMSTGERTALSYLIKPVTDQMNRAFRE